MGSPTGISMNSLNGRDARFCPAPVTARAFTTHPLAGRATGNDRSEIVRTILHVWALQKIDAATVLHRLLRAEGLPGIAEGVPGNRGESHGTSGNRGQS